MQLHFVKGHFGVKVFACAAIAFAIWPASAADAAEISSDDATAVCELFLGAPQTKTQDPTIQWVEGVERTIGDDCRTGDPDPNTVIAICRAHVSELDSTFVSGSPSGSTFQIDTLAADDPRERAGASVCSGGSSGLCTDGAVGANCVNTLQISSTGESAQNDNGSGFQAPEPGVNVSNLDELSAGLTFYALVFCVGGICVSAALWAMGSRGQNPGTELAGKRGLIVCVSAAFFIGAVPAWINYLDELSSQNDPSGVTQTDIPIRRDG